MEKDYEKKNARLSGALRGQSGNCYGNKTVEIKILLFWRKEYFTMQLLVTKISGLAPIY